MSHGLVSRLTDLYAGEVGEVWGRIERESPATYWEENAVLGRRDTAALLIRRLEPRAGLRILDAGCGRGLLAGRLARAGAEVTAVDLVFSHVLEARKRIEEGGPTLVAADFRDLLAATPDFDEVILQEVFEDYLPEERLDAIKGLAGGGPNRIHLIFREPGSWGRMLIDPLLPTALVATLDPVQLIRSVQLHTPYRLTHQESVRRRSYSVRWVELTLQPEMMRSNL